VLLAIDTSTQTLGVALYDGMQILGEVTWQSRSYHTVELGPAVAQILDRARIPILELRALGVAIGPGSFTGLRIGLAFAKGLAFSHQLPILGIPTLDALAAAQPLRDIPMAALLQAGRKRLAVGWYQNNAEKWESVGSLENVTIEDFAQRINKPTYICGELSQEARSRLGRKYKNVRLATPAQSLRRAAFLAELAWDRWQSGQTDDPAVLSPIYLHQGTPIPE
jgi:tRNA threonylcarbamoyladenosine biosynthesis protein TsaB